MPYVNDELHHAGWNICSSCHDSERKRNTIVLPCLMSDRIYFIDTTNATAPMIKKVRNILKIILLLNFKSKKENYSVIKF